MSGHTSIEWCTDVWNPTAGCDKVSPGCDHCYAMTMAKRLKAMGQDKYQLDGDPRTSGPGFMAHEWPVALDWPLTVQKPMRVFVNSMSDLFHKSITDDYIARVFAVMALAPQHTFQVLTKRHGRMESLLGDEDFRSIVAQTIAGWCVDEGYDDEHLVDAHPDWYPLRNVHLGVSVEDQARARLRLDALRRTPAAVRFVSAEPLLGGVDMVPWLHSELCAMGGGGPLCACCPGDARIDWVIVGGESGPGARPMHPDWVRSLRDQCTEADVPFLFKQWGNWAPHTSGGVRLGDVCMTPDGDTYTVDRDYICAHNESEGAWLRNVGKKVAGRELDGRTWDEFPVGGEQG